ncbi:MAG: hypothetical protein LCH98_17875 [Actinobacteria bacterium]|nr:hypothetical protein [Actinomycetota bacterium]
MGRGGNGQDEAQRQHDAAIWKTLLVNELSDVNRFHEVETVPVLFAPQLAPDERFVAAGHFQLYDYGAVGDGTYERNSGFFFAAGPAGLALTGGVAAARAIGNASRRSRAASDAIPRWKVIDQGQIWVSHLGFSMRGQQSFLVWDWPSILAVELIGPGRLCFDGESDRGRIRWILQSDWAELAFTLWARARHPQHPQFVGRTWIPPGWAERTIARGYALPPALSGRWQVRDIQDS